jgi:hypothetical protein
MDEGLDIAAQSELEKIVKERIKFPPKPILAKVTSFAKKLGKSLMPKNQWHLKDGNYDQKSGGEHNRTLYSVHNTKVQKTDSNVYCYDELARIFVLSAQSYLTEYRHSPCTYSRWMNEFMQNLDQYKSPGKDDNHGIIYAVMKTGDLFDDPETEVEKPDEHYYFRNQIDNITDELNATNDKETIEFIFEFCGTTGCRERNAILEKYVTRVFERARK